MSIPLEVSASLHIAGLENRIAQLEHSDDWKWYVAELDAAIKEQQ